MSDGNFRELGLALNRLLMLKESSDLRELNSDILDAKVRLELERDNYMDSKKEAKKWEDAGLVIEEQFTDTGIALDKLNEELGTPGGVESLLNNLEEAETLSFSSKAGDFNTKAEIYKERYKKINSIMDEQIGLAKSIQSGGIITPVLGASPTEWDPEDLGVDAYRHHLGLDESQETPLLVEEYFKSTPDKTNKELVRLTRELSTQTFYDTRNEKEQKAQLKLDGTTYFNRRLKNSSALSSYDDLVIGVSLTSPENKEIFEEYYTSEQDRNQYIQQTQLLMAKFGTEFGTMIGNQDAKDNAFTYYSNYKTMIEQATPETAKYQGVVSPADYSMYNIYVQQTWDNYSAQETDAGKLQILEYAQKYLGLPPNMSMEEFMLYHNKFYAGVTLEGFEGKPIDPIEIPLDDEEVEDPEEIDGGIFENLEVPK